MFADRVLSLASSSYITIATLIVALTIILNSLTKRHKYMKEIEKVPGPPAQIPLFGSITDFLVEPEDFLSHSLRLHKRWSRQIPILRVWIGHYPVFLISKAVDTEILLSSQKFLDKSPDYNFLHPWLGTGLLTSTGEKWFGRRKMLTPTFHFKILEDFLHIFNEQSRILVDKLLEAVKNCPQETNMNSFVTRCTLDIICESAMGRHVDAQNMGDSDYVQAVYKMSDIVQLRQVRPWLQPELLFQLSSYGAEQRRCLKILHDFTDKVIREKKLEHQQRGGRPERTNDDDEFTTRKRRMAFLDLLIEASQDGKVLNDMDIREEVDTFMFEGHDTTAAAINWSLFLIGSHPHVQELVHEELNRVFGDSDRPATTADLNELKYLECCIKEALRLYPSVPYLARTLSEDAKMHGFNIPAGSTVILFTYLLHRDPQYFPDPEVFNPERFFPENVQGRHPYAYVPFSAGPRNCIGQKFALMEEKVVLSTIFRNFNVKSLVSKEELVLMSQLILRPLDGIRVQLTRKQA